MKQLIIIIAIGFIPVLFYCSANGQGCVAIRSTGGICTMEHNEHIDTLSKWSLALNNRYFKSFRHFVGTKEQKQRVAEGSEVINHSYTLDIFLSRNIDQRWSVGVNIPVIANSRSSLYEHDRESRHSTHSFGLGDMRLAVYRWFIHPKKMPRGNVQFGLGMKLPTGDYNYQDFFYKSDSLSLLGPVDQSIQLGDGGTGITAEINAFYSLSHSVSLYSNLFYLANPREQNGTSTARGGTPSANSVAYGSSTMSVPDQYMIRAGANFTSKNLTVSLGLRDECLPVKDLIGGSSGFRRPGFVISAEPGFNYQMKKSTLYAFVPVALVRDRTQSVPDKVRTRLTGTYAQGDAAFADYSVNIGLITRF